MESKDILLREDNLSNWRLGTLLTFSALLMLLMGNFRQEAISKIQLMAPIVGFLVSISILYAGLMSAHVRYRLHLDLAVDGVSPITRSQTRARFMFWSALGPTIFCPFIMTIFWLLVLEEVLAFSTP